jgi:hypothetical protein
MSGSRKLPSEPILNPRLTAEFGRPIVMFDVVPVKPGETLTIKFKGGSAERRQGIWLGVDGELEVAGARGDQIDIWMDTAPPDVKVAVLRTEDCLLRLYNIWDLGPGRRHESQSHTSGMLKSSDNGTITYGCNDFGIHPKFDHLVFELSR